MSPLLPPTQGVAGKNLDETPRYLPLTYDHAVKICSDSTETAIAAFAGHGAIGQQTVSDFFSRVAANLNIEPASQDARVQQLGEEMVAARRAFFEELNLPFDQAPQTTILLAAPPLGAVGPRVWRIVLSGSEFHTQEILQGAGVWLEADAGFTLTLLYGWNTAIAEEVRKALGVDEKRFNRQSLHNVTCLPFPESTSGQCLSKMLWTSPCFAPRLKSRWSASCPE
jgi:hypothetical protein